MGLALGNKMRTDGPMPSVSRRSERHSSIPPLLSSVSQEQHGRGLPPQPQPRPQKKGHEEQSHLQSILGGAYFAEGLSVVWLEKGQQIL